METLPQLVTALNKEEVRHLKLYLSRIQTQHARKDELLFDYARTKKEKYDEAHILKKLYGHTPKGAFYRLRGRLQDCIIQNLVALHQGKTDKNKVLLYFSAYQILWDKGNYELACTYLRKTEKLAVKAENYELLDLIYGHFVKISAELPSMNPEVYIAKRRQNALQLNKLREMDQVLAATVYRLKFSQAKGRQDETTLKILSSITAKYSADKSLQKSKTFQTRLYRAVSQILLQRHNYRELESFMVTIYRKFNSARWFDKSNHDTKLQMLVFLMNSYSRNGKYALSLKYADILGQEINAFNRLHYWKYVFYYYNARVINYSEKEPQKALVALKELEETIKGRRETYYEMFIHLNRGILFFKTGKYNEAIRSFVKYYTNDYYRKSDQLFKLRVTVAEMMMQVESKDYRAAKIRLEQVQKQFKNEIMLPEAYAENHLLELIRLIIKEKLQFKNDKVQQAMQRILKDKKITANNDNQLLNYQEWLAQKVFRKQV
ncbi:MAG: hypothetical protein U0T84_03090 [Chitinophagales bacterium]